MFKDFIAPDLQKTPKLLEKTIRSNEKMIQKLLAQPLKTYRNFVLPLLMLDENIDELFQPISHLHGVKNSKKTQKAMKISLPMLSEYHAKIGQNAKLYEALKTIQNSEGETLVPQQKQALKLEILGFELSGVALEKKAKSRLKEIFARLSQLENDFSQNVLEDTNAYEMVLEECDTVGMPQGELDAARIEKDGKTLYRFTLHAPSFMAYMTYGPNREKREQIYRAYVTRGVKNEELIDEILSLRDEKAKLLGYKNYADVSLASKMAKDSQAVLGFLYDLAQKSRPQAQKELDELKQFAAQDGIEELQSYDVAFYSEKLRRANYDIDEEYYRNYFESDSVLLGMFEMIERLFGIRFFEVKAKLWHKKARCFELFEHGTPIGRLYIDLEARENKKGGAWMDHWTTGCIDEKGSRTLPIAFIVCNFPPSSKERPSLLRHGDVETLFHEMGHALHHLLSTVHTRTVSGVQGVAWDAVEFPSQFLENFVFEAQVLRLFAKHYQTLEPLSENDIAKLKNAKDFQAALGILRQLEFAIFDFKLHTELFRGEEVQNLLDSVRDEISLLKPPAYNRFQNSFSHIFGGSYAAGYYSYKWAEVLSADAFMAFVTAGVFDRQLGERFRKTVMAKGGSQDMNELFHEFAGREPDAGSLLKLCGING